MKKHVILLILILTLPLASCSRSPSVPDTQSIVSSIMDSQKNLPAGRIFSSDLDKANKNYPTDSLLVSYFGEPNVSKYKESWYSFSFFLASGASTCEIAVIYCSTPESLTDTARLLSRRVDAIKKLLHDAIPEHKILTYKNYAILFICSDPSSAEKALKKAC